MTKGAVENRAMFPIVMDEVMRYESRVAGAVSSPFWSSHSLQASESPLCIL